MALIENQRYVGERVDLDGNGLPVVHVQGM